MRASYNEDLIFETITAQLELYRSMFFAGDFKAADAAAKRRDRGFAELTTTEIDILRSVCASLGFLVAPRRRTQRRASHQPNSLGMALN